MAARLAPDGSLKVIISLDFRKAWAERICCVGSDRRRNDMGQIREGWVQSITRLSAGFAVNLDQEIIESRFVLLAGGVADHLPPLRGAQEALLRSARRVCSVCDGFEAIDRDIAVIGDGERGEREAAFLRTYSERVCYVHVSGESDPKRRQRLKEQGIDLIDTRMDQLFIREGTLVLEAPQMLGRKFDVFYTALGCTPRTELAEVLGAVCDTSRALQVSSHQQTSVDGLYAAGDMVRGLKQVVVAAAEAAVACADIHNRLRSTLW